MITGNAMIEALSHHHNGSHVYDPDEAVFHADVVDERGDSLGVIVVAPGEVSVHGSECLWDVVQVAAVLTLMDAAPPAPARCWFEHRARAHERQ